jgi:hypothetical protein
MISYSKLQPKFVDHKMSAIIAAVESRLTIKLFDIPTAKHYMGYHS